MAAPATSCECPGGEHGERDFPKVTVPPLDPDNRKKAW
jgi:hypothetical protein